MNFTLVFTGTILIFFTLVLAGKGIVIAPFIKASALDLFFLMEGVLFPCGVRTGRLTLLTRSLFLHFLPFFFDS